MWSTRSQLVLRIYLIIVLLSKVRSSRRHSWAMAVEVENPHCKSRECRERSNYYKSSMDTFVNPCTDFYQYVCGNWDQMHPLPPYTRAWVLAFSMQAEAYKQMRDLLGESVKSTDTTEVKQAKLAYKACMNIPSLKRGNPDFLKKYVTQSGYVPMFITKQKNAKTKKPWEIDNFYLGITGESPHFMVDIAVESLNNGEPTICFHQILSPYGTLLRVSKWKAEEVKNYILYLDSMIKSVSPSNVKIPVKELEEQVDDVLHLRIKMQRIIVKYNNEPGKPILTSIKDFQQWYDKVTNKAESAQINWLKHVQALYKDTKINDSKMIKVMNLDYFEALGNLLSLTDEKTIINHIHLYFLERHAIRSKTQQKLLEDSLSYIPVATGGIFDEVDRWYICIDDHAMTEAIGKLYVKKYFPASAKKEAETLGKNVKKMIKEQISDSPWLDTKTKSKTMSRIEDISYTIGYPEWSGQSPKKRNTAMPENVLKANAAFLLADNRMLFYAGYLKSPMFDESVPYVLNYGAAASMMGHEMYHSIDESAIRPNNNGKFSWPSTAYTTYEDKAKCFIKQYNNYPIKELEKYHIAMKIDGKKTLEENIADTMGLKAAYRAFKKKLQQENGVCPILPTFDNIKCEHLFFIAYASTHCGVVPRNIMLEHATVDKHAPLRARVNLPLANMQEFAVAFNCSKNSPLNPSTRCDIWE